MPKEDGQMKVGELVRALQALGIEAQDLPVTSIRDDFPRNVNFLQIADATPSGDHWSISYAPEIDKLDGEDVRKIIVLREFK
jgi:hypothetical protein